MNKNHKKNVLLVQFRENKLIADHERRCILRALKNNGVNILSKNLFFDSVDSLKNLDIDAIIIGGTGKFSFSKRRDYPELFARIKKSFSFIKKAIKNKVPILGIFFGHLYLGYILGAEIIYDEKQKEFGTFVVHLTQKGKKDMLFSGLPDDFLVQQGHEDSIRSLPKNTTALATGDNCRIECFKIKNKNVYGVQFHPELDKEDCKERLRLDNMSDDIYFKKSPLPKKIISNFINLS
jgi:GMP synthase (glutamine-hydrolysing)